jgi:hypothetical protein
MAQFNTTELDFDQIKENLKTHFLRSDGPFKDFDFEGSGLSALLDVLAYNTHYNAINAHMAMNESFLDSAQLRSNVVSRAKLLGYTPASKTAPTATIRLVLRRQANATNETVYTLPEGTKFTTEVNGITYTYQTVTPLGPVPAVETTEGSGIFEFTFDKVEIKEGRKKKAEYTVDTNVLQKFLVNDSAADTSTLKVEVFNDLNANDGVSYSLFEEFVGVNELSEVYFLSENGDGLFDVTFGDGVLGKKLIPSNIVRLEYLVTAGKDSNGANLFTYAGGSNTIVQDQNNSVTLQLRSQGGSDRQSIESIKHNAPLRFISQDRAVTAEDYKALISNNNTLANIGSVSVWGGEDNEIVDYGKVYISIKPADNVSETLTDLEKENVLRFLEDKKVISILPKLIDPDFLYIYFDLFFKFDSSKTTLSKEGLVINVKDTITNFNNSFLNNFDGIYRHSNFLSTIDNSLPAILNTTARVYLYKKLVINVVDGVSTNKSVDFKTTLDGKVDQTESMISSSVWTYNNKRVQLADEKIVGSETKRNVFIFSSLPDGNNEIIIKSVGEVDVATGLVSLQALPANDTTTIEVSARPAADDVVSRFNEILTIDLSKTNITADLDTSVSGSVSSLKDYNTFSRDR